MRNPELVDLSIDGLIEFMERAVCPGVVFPVNDTRVREAMRCEEVIIEILYRLKEKKILE